MKFRALNTWRVSIFEADDIEQLFRHEPKYPVRGDMELLDVYETRCNTAKSLLTL